MEIWKEILNSNGNYEISNYGNIRNKNGLMKPQLDRGYLKVRLIINGVRKGYPIHRLVGLAFIPNPHNKKCINHIDGNKTNNNISNLEWVTHSENNIHAYKNNLQPSKKGIKNGRAKLNESQVIDIKNSNKGCVELSKIYNVTPTTISYIKLGRNWGYLK